MPKTFRVAIDLAALVAVVFVVTVSHDPVVAGVLCYALGASAVARLRWIQTGEWRWP